jgi:hypothetical protein
VGRVRGSVALVVLVAVLTAGLTTAGSTGPAAWAGTPVLKAPNTTPAEDNTYLADAAKADSTLATYVQQHGDVALRAMLTDGTAFCAFLRRGGGIDTAIVDTAVGARSVETTTHLPNGVTTFNTLESVALLELCPSEQRLVPASVRTKLHGLKKALGNPAVG